MSSKRYLVIGLTLLGAWNASAATVQKVSAGIVIHGEIKRGDLKQLKGALSTYGNLPLLLDSGGGQVAEALEIAEYVKATGMRTHIPAKGICASACVLVFAGGAVRTAHQSAKIGVHMGSGLLTDKTMLAMREVYKKHGADSATYIASMFEQAAAISILKQVNFYLSSGVSLRLLQLTASVEHLDIRWLTSGEARDYNLVNAD